MSTSATTSSSSEAPPTDMPGAPAAPGPTRGSFLRHNRWWIGRVAVLPLHMLAFAVLAFFLVRAVPGDPVLTVISGNENWTQEDYDATEKALGLDGSLFGQLIRYLNDLVHLDFGTSMYTGRSVRSEILQRLPATIELALLGMAGVIIFSAIGSYLVVRHPRNPLSWLLRLYSRLAGGVPQFILAVAAIFVFYATLGWAPAPIGRLSPGVAGPEPMTRMPLVDALLQGNTAAAWSMIQHLILPVSVMVLAQSDVLMKILISSLEDAVDSPQTLMRISSGARYRTVILSAYRRALPPAATMAGVMFGQLLGGAVILEQLFGFGAMGDYAIEAVNTKDIVALQGFLLISAAVSLIVFLLVDLVNMLLDPRRRPGARVEA